MAVIPPYLKKGDTIGIVAPAGYMAVERMQTCIETLDGWGYSVKMGATTHSASLNYFSGTDEERAADFQQMLDDPEVNAILCARGGYGTSRIKDQLSFRKFRKKPKWIIGFSDITVLHAHLYSRYRIASMHAPMAGAFAEGENNNPYLQSLKNVLEGGPTHYETPWHALNTEGKAKGILVGGNLSLIAHLIGTRSAFTARNRILFLEDIGEYLYNSDRMLVQLNRSGFLDKPAGVIVGGFTDMKDTDRPFGQGIEEIIRSQIKGKYPVSFGFPVSHDRENFALKVGARYQLDVKKDRTILSENP